MQVCLRHEWQRYRRGRKSRGGERERALFTCWTNIGIKTSSSSICGRGACGVTQSSSPYPIHIQRVDLILRRFGKKAQMRSSWAMVSACNGIWLLPALLANFAICDESVFFPGSGASNRKQDFQSEESQGRQRFLADMVPLSLLSTWSASLAWIENPSFQQPIGEW